MVPCTVVWGRRGEMGVGDITKGLRNMQVSPAHRGLVAAEVTVVMKQFHWYSADQGREESFTPRHYRTSLYKTCLLCPL